jgi:hypothetical protein
MRNRLARVLVQGMLGGTQAEILVIKSRTLERNKSICCVEYKLYSPCAALFHRSSQAVTFFWSSFEYALAFARSAFS